MTDFSGDVLALIEARHRHLRELVESFAFDTASFKRDALTSAVVIVALAVVGYASDDLWVMTLAVAIQLERVVTAANQIKQLKTHMRYLQTLSKEHRITQEYYHKIRTLVEFQRGR